MKIEGEPLKRYRLSYWGTSLGSFDTASEAVNEMREHEKLIRPAVDPKKKGRYSVRDERKEITIEELVRRAKADV